MNIFIYSEILIVMTYMEYKQLQVPNVFILSCLLKLLFFIPTGSTEFELNIKMLNSCHPKASIRTAGIIVFVVVIEL